ncbi:MAG: LapA family protein [Desulfobacterales bacterium]
MYEHNDNLNLDIVVLDFSISPMPMAIFFIAFFLIGYFIAFCFGLIEKHRMKKTIQELNSKLNEQDKKLGSLINEADSLKVRRQESNQPKADDGPDSKEKDLSGALGNPKKES